MKRVYRVSSLVRIYSGSCIVGMTCVEPGLLDEEPISVSMLTHEALAEYPLDTYVAVTFSPHTPEPAGKGSGADLFLRTAKHHI